LSSLAVEEQIFSDIKHAKSDKAFRELKAAVKRQA
jgi:hypothetical protein